MSRIHPVEPEDLLGRQAREPSMSRITAYILKARQLSVRDNFLFGTVGVFFCLIQLIDIGTNASRCRREGRTSVTDPVLPSTDKLSLHRVLILVRRLSRSCPGVTRG